MAVSVIIATQLFESLAKLPASDHVHVIAFISAFQANPAHPSISLERVNKARSKGIWSGRVGRGVRAILHKDAGAFAQLDAPGAQSEPETRLGQTGAGAT